jgi:predicted  nucleic acid-binding Zn-ribbon protein
MFSDKMSEDESLPLSDIDSDTEKDPMKEPFVPTNPTRVCPFPGCRREYTRKEHLKYKHGVDDESVMVFIRAISNERLKQNTHCLTCTKCGKVYISKQNAYRRKGCGIQCGPSYIMSVVPSKQDTWPEKAQAAIHRVEVPYSIGIKGIDYEELLNMWFANRTSPDYDGYVANKIARTWRPRLSELLTATDGLLDRNELERIIMRKDDIDTWTQLYGAASPSALK